MNWTRVKPIKGKIRGCFHNPVYDEAPPDMLIAVGFGEAKVTKDGETVYKQPTGFDEGEIWTTEDAEELAWEDPDHDWRIVLYAPLYGRTFQRQDGHWFLIEENRGFA